jgi:hypothetical protein
MGSRTTRNDGAGVVPMSSDDYSWLFRRLGGGSLSLEELKRRQGVRRRESIDDMTADLWESDEDLDAFLADVRASRDADLA